MGVVSWVVLGTLVGVVVNRGRPGSFPGGLPGTIASAAAGAFLGGAIFTLLADRPGRDIDLLSLLIALLGAGLLLAAVRKAAYHEPGTQ